MNEPPGTPTNAGRRRLGLMAAALFAATIAAYLPALRAGFVWDDNTLVTADKFLRSWSGLGKFWFSTQTPDYWPVTSTVFWIEWRLWGMHAAGYHAVNLMLHVAEALMLWRVLWRLRVPGAYLAAFLFALHPVNVESVAWISELKNLMAMLFFLLSILAFIQYNGIFTGRSGRSGRIRRVSAFSCLGGAARPETLTEPFLQEGREDREGRHSRGSFIPDPATETTAMLPDLPDLPVKENNSTTAASRSSCTKWYFASLLLFVLAMLSKGSVAMEPFVLAGIILWRRPLGWRDVTRLAPFFAVSAGLVLTDVWFQRHGTGAVFRHADLLQRLLGAGSVIWFYLYKALLPLKLIFVYPLWNIRPADPLWWIPLAAAMAATVAFWRARGPGFRAVRYAWGFFCVALFPVLGLTDVYFMRFSLVADRYEHIALIGVVTLAAFAWSAWNARSGASPLPAAAAAAVLACLGILTWRHCRVFRNSETLYRSVLERNPGAWIAYNNLGNLEYRQGRMEEAIARYREALRLNPDISEAEDNLGLALVRTGRLQEALPHFRRAISINPADAEPYENLGVALNSVGRSTEAIVDFQAALHLVSSDDAMLRFNLGNAYAALGRFPEAIASFRDALRLEPDYAAAHCNLGAALAQTGEMDQAVAELRQAIADDPNDPSARRILNEIQGVTAPP